jgi:predicted nucleic acid-binding protein
MSGFLIDTNVLSEYNRPGGPDAGVKRWLETTDRQSQHLSVITLAEIQKGIELLAEGKRRAQLEQWLKQDLKPGFPVGYFRWIARWPVAGHLLWRREHGRAGFFPRSIH